VGLRYVGVPPAADADLATTAYVQSIKSADLDSGAVDTRINSGLSSYPTVAYADTRDALLATTAYVNTQDNLRIKLAQKDQINGVAALDATGKIDPNRINGGNTQNYVRGPWSPAAFHSAQVITADTLLYSCPVGDPGYPYKLIIFGQIEASAISAGVDEYPIVNIRQGNATTGPIIATGSGITENFWDLQSQMWGDSSVNPSTYTIPPWADRVDVVCLGAGGGGGGGDTGFGFTGEGGVAGDFTWATLTKGFSYAPGASLSINVGVAGVRGGLGSGGHAGGDSTVSYANFTTGTTSTITGDGGRGGAKGNDNNNSGTPGRAVGVQILNGHSYTGGGSAGTAVDGHPPGGGGGPGVGGTLGGGAPGRIGSDGAVWVFAYGYPANNQGCAVPIMPIALAAQAALTGATTLYVRANRSGAGSSIHLPAEQAGLFVLAVPA
jgi:hypothetical protein